MRRRFVIVATDPAGPWVVGQHWTRNRADARMRNLSHLSGFKGVVLSVRDARDSADAEVIRHAA